MGVVQNLALKSDESYLKYFMLGGIYLLLKNAFFNMG